MKLRATLLTSAAVVALATLPAQARGPWYFNVSGGANWVNDDGFFAAYNNCELATLGAIVDERLEFYHDKDGLTLGKAPFIDAIKQYICNTVERRLVASSLQVFPLENYGAIEIGEHTFCNRVETPVCKDETNGIGRFFMLWQKQGETYRLTRVISYDHLNDRERKAKAQPAR